MLTNRIKPNIEECWVKDGIYLWYGTDDDDDKGNGSNNNDDDEGVGRP